MKVTPDYESESCLESQLHWVEVGLFVQKTLLDLNSLRLRFDMHLPEWQMHKSYFAQNIAFLHYWANWVCLKTHHSKPYYDKA